MWLQAATAKTQSGMLNSRVATQPHLRKKRTMNHKIAVSKLDWEQSANDLEGNVLMEFDLGPLINPKTGKPNWKRSPGEHCGYNDCEICRREAVAMTAVVPQPAEDEEK